ncbi:MAG: N-acetylglucosamine-6-phosphate deacetylase [Acidobacteriaceae bacterium]
MIYVENAILHTPSEIIEPGAMIIDGERIRATGSSQELARPQAATVIDAGGRHVVPGFIDLQINGAFGLDLTAHPESIWKVGEYLTRFGVTAFLPTIVSSPVDTIHRAQEAWQKGPPAGYRGARAIGLHLEGPYLNPEKAGAHDPAFLQLPDPQTYHSWTPQHGVRLVTLSPELPDAVQAIRHLVQNGVVVSAGHSLASFEQAQAGFEAGIRYGTHLFNAMAALDHHNPGLPGALLGDSRLTAGLIVDGFHVHPAMVKLAWKMLGAGRMSLVTDAMAALGMPPGRYMLGSQSVIVDGTYARLEDGRLAGSLLSLDQAMRNLVEFSGASLHEALLTITQVPARLLQLEASSGVLASGAQADFVLLTHDYQVAGVWIGGQKVFQPAS